jgi:hypothetical protein
MRAHTLVPTYAVAPELPIVVNVKSRCVYEPREATIPTTRALVRTITVEFASPSAMYLIPAFKLHARAKRSQKRSHTMRIDLNWLNEKSR